MPVEVSVLVFHLENVTKVCVCNDWKNMIQFTNQCGNGIELGIGLIFMCKFTLVKSGWEAVHAILQFLMNTWCRRTYCVDMDHSKQMCVWIFEGQCVCYLE